MKSSSAQDELWLKNLIMTSIDDKKQSPWGTYGVGGLKKKWLGCCHGIKNRRLALWVRKPLKNSFQEWADVEVWGLRLRISPKGNLSEQRLLLMPQHLDSREREILAQELAGGGVFFDIGANAGVYSLWMASRGIVGLRIEAFEPDPILCERLKFNLAENELSSVTLNEHALGAETGELILARREGNLGQNEIVASGKGTKVAVKTLAQVLGEKNIEKIDALKIDIEGYERVVLDSFFKNTPSSTWPRLVICETLDGGVETEGAKALLAAGYEVSEHTRMNGIFRLNGEV